MKRLLILAAFLCSTALAACPTHPGYIANGAAKQPSGLQAICGQAYATFNKSFAGDPTVRWTELYGVKNSANATALAQQLRGSLERLGYVLAQNKRTADGLTLGFLNPNSRKIIVLSAMVAGPLVLISLAGN